MKKLLEAVDALLRGRLGSAGIGSDTRWRLRAAFDTEAIVQRGELLESYPLKTVGDEIQLGEPKQVTGPLLALSRENAHGQILGPVVEEASGKPGAKWLVCAIAEGMSKNRTFYSADVLREAVPLYEGAKVFYNHSKTSMRDPRDVAGQLEAARFGTLTPEGAKGTPRAMVLATMVVTSAQLREQLIEAFDAGKPDLLGLSHCAACEYDLVRLADGAAKKVKKIQAVESVDVVPFPSAGGRVMRLVAGLKSPVSETGEDLVMLDKKIAKLKEARPDLFAKLGAEPTEAEVDALLLEAMQPAPAPTPTPAPTPAANASIAEIALRAMVNSQAQPAAAAATMSESDRRTLHEAKVERFLKNRTMRPSVLETLRESLYSRLGASDADISAEVERTVKMDAKISAGAQRIGSGLGTTIEAGPDEADKILEAVDGYFMRGASEEVRAEYRKLTGHDAPRDGFRSIKRLYEDVTGDRDVTGYIPNAAAKRRFQRILEAIQTTTFANLLGDSITRRMLAEYRATDFSQRWRRICSRITSLSDFRTQERLRWGSFADLGTVAQLQPYPLLSNPTDEKVTYAPSKRGGIVEISREAIKNDDVGLTQELPKRLALAAARTLHKFVFNLFITNPTLDDGVAVFAAAITRGFSSAGNIQTAVLSTTTVGIARQRLLRVLDRDVNTPLGLSPKILIVPPELEEIGWRLTSIPVAPVSGQNATEPAIIPQRYGLNELIVLEHVTDPSDYYILADPTIVNTIEMGFVDGQEEPALFTQDQENVGSVFSADKLSWKVRHEYGGKVVDWRGFQGGIGVA